MARKLRYFYEFKLVEEDGNYKYTSIGVWTHDPATNDINIAFLPEYWEEEFEGTQPLNGLIERDIPIPLDFYDRWNEYFSSYKEIGLYEKAFIDRELVFTHCIPFSSIPFVIKGTEFR